MPGVRAAPARVAAGRCWSLGLHGDAACARVEPSPDPSSGAAPVSPRSLFLPRSGGEEGAQRGGHPRHRSPPGGRSARPGLAAPASSSASAACLRIARHGFHRRGESLRAGRSASIATPLPRDGAPPAEPLSSQRALGSLWVGAGGGLPPRTLGPHREGEPGEMAPRAGRC